MGLINKKIKPKKLIAILIFLAIAGGVCFVPISIYPVNALITYALEKRLDADIEYGRMTVKLVDSLKAGQIKVTGSDGVTITIKDALFSYSLITLFTTGRLGVKCELEDVKIAGKASIVELLADLLSLKGLDNIRFYRIGGHFYVGRDDTITRDLAGESQLLRFRVDALTGRDNSINVRLKLSLNKDIESTMSKEVRNVVFEKEPGGWMSLVVGITGNYEEPSLRLLNKHFKLDISTK